MWQNPFTVQASLLHFCFLTIEAFFSWISFLYNYTLLTLLLPEKWATLHQNTRQKIINRGALRLCKGGLTFKFDKNFMIYSVSYFRLGGLRALFGGLSPPKLPHGDRTALHSVCNLLTSLLSLGSLKYFLWSLLCSFLQLLFSTKFFFKKLHMSIFFEDQQLTAIPFKSTRW